MINNVLSFFRRFWGNSSREVSNTSKNNKLVDVVVPHKNEKIKIPALLKNKKTNNYIVKTEKPLTKISIMNKIKKNIFFLDELLELLDGKKQYQSYYLKVKDMKEQSEGCYKIVFRMKEEAPYFQSTLKMILNHTNTIKVLLKIK